MISRLTSSLSPLLLASAAQAEHQHRGSPVSSRTELVHGYLKADGTYVTPYLRAMPHATFLEVVHPVQMKTAATSLVALQNQRAADQEQPRIVQEEARELETTAILAITSPSQNTEPEAF